jgi:hypothetical protein
VLTGTNCCLRVLFDCGGVPAEVKLCALACDWRTVGLPTPTVSPGLALQASPNPTLGSTTLDYAVPRAGEARIEVFDTAGRLVRTLLVGPVAEGPGSITWNGRGERGEALPSGVYLARLSIAGGVANRKILLVR